MAESVKLKRPYESPRRREQAAATRLEILDVDIAELWMRVGIEYHANQRTIIESIDQKNALRPDLDLDRATDILWTINHPNTWQLLVTQRGWTPEQYERWTTQAAISQLLNPQPADRASTPNRLSTREKRRS